MAICYKKLWKMLINRDMQKSVIGQSCPIERCYCAGNRMLTLKIS